MYRRNGRGRLLVLIFLALSVVIITLDFRGGSSGPLNSVRDFAQTVVAPIQRGITTVTRPVGNFFSSIGDLADLREENKRLKQDNEQLQTEIDQARDLTEENAELLANLELDESWLAMDRVAAQVIGDAPGNFKWAVLIDKGSEDGIEEDMAVINPDGLVGKVIRTSADTSLVLLLIDPNIGVAATDEDGNIRGSITGNGEGEGFSLQYVDKESEADVGTRIVTSNFNRGIYPRGIPIGFISNVSGDVRATDLDITVNPAVDFADLNVVQILLGSGSKVAGGNP
jgi:rod shape-determining protein MreC